MNKRSIFISHIAQEKDIALALQKFFKRLYLGSFNVFVSSDSNSIELGDSWQNIVFDSIQTCDLMLVLCSPVSITRPWIPFEAGAGWSRKIPVIPVCHSGLTPGELPLPFSTLQGCVLSEEKSVQQILARISKLFDLEIPELDSSTFIESIKDMEQGEKESKVRNDHLFAYNYIKRRVFVVLYSIFQSTVDVVDENKLDFIEYIKEGKFDYHKIYNSFHYSHYDHSKQIKVYEELFTAIMSLCDDIRFLLTFNRISLSYDTINRFEKFLCLKVFAEGWYDDMHFIEQMLSNPELEKRTMEEIQGEPLPLKRRDSSNIINSLMDYYDSLSIYANSLIDIIDSLQRVIGK